MLEGSEALEVSQAVQEGGGGRAQGLSRQGLGWGLCQRPLPHLFGRVGGNNSHAGIVLAAPQDLLHSSHLIP